MQRVPMLLWMLLAGAALTLSAGCTRLPTYSEAQATAQAGGCWPDYLPTPPLVTVTPAPEADPAQALPTATPFPICPPRPGRPAVVWPTPVPPPPAYPTMVAQPWLTGGDQATTLHLPSAVLELDLAVHPTEGWPAVAAVVWSGTSEPERVMLSVYQPHVGRWSIARQVDLGPSQIGHYSRTAAVAISGDGQVHALWGMSDPNFVTGDPPSGLWASSSADFGESWSAPTRIATGCRRVNDVVAGLDGTLVAMLICDAGTESTLAMVTRRADGTWLPVKRLPAPAQYYSEGALAIVGTEDEARVVGLAFITQGSAALGYLLSRALTSDAPWQLERLTLHAPTEDVLGSRMWRIRGLSYLRPTGPALTFTWTAAETGHAFALTSPDGGRHWGPLELVASPLHAGGRIIDALPGYDPLADRLVTVWDCCAGGLFSTAASTHYGSWSVPGSGNWSPAGGAAPAPLVLGSRAAGRSAAAQAVNSRTLWVAWIERQKQVEVRSLELNQVVPVEAYPTATPFIVPGGQP